jgi:hypothetical protein
MTVTLATPQGIIREQAAALERAVALDREAEALETAGRPVDAAALRSRARVIRALWE